MAPRKAVKKQDSLTEESNPNANVEPSKFVVALMNYMHNSRIKKNQVHPQANRGQVKCQRAKEISTDPKISSLYLLVLIVFYFENEECGMSNYFWLRHFCINKQIKDLLRLLLAECKRELF
jgi:hypothetical protein